MKTKLQNELSARHVHAEALESRLALAMASRLNLAADGLPHDISERLRFARERAVKAARPMVAAATATLLPNGGQSVVMGGGPSFWVRLASVLPLALLVAGLVLIQQHHDLEQISVAAEIDSALLADDLPPDAYRDPGFGEFLRSSNDQ